MEEGANGRKHKHHGKSPAKTHKSRIGQAIKNAKGILWDMLLKNWR